MKPPEEATHDRDAPSRPVADAPDAHHRMIRPIGFIRSCFGEKFATPRQPGLCPSSWATLVFEEEFRNPDALRGIDGFSHVWLVFGFHETIDQGWHPTVRPPRLGGNERVGVFASRSTFRPNGLGLSLARLDAVHTDAPDGPVLMLGGIDLIDGTPVYDIKPYLPYAESIPDARSGFANDPIPRLHVVTSPSTRAAFDNLTEREQAVIRETLSLDPRPATSPADPLRIHGALLCGRNVRFVISGNICEIREITSLPPP